MKIQVKIITQNKKDSLMSHKPRHQQSKKDDRVEFIHTLITAESTVIIEEKSERSAELDKTDFRKLSHTHACVRAHTQQSCKMKNSL